MLCLIHIKVMFDISSGVQNVGNSDARESLSYVRSCIISTSVLCNSRSNKDNRSGNKFGSTTH